MEVPAELLISEENNFKLFGASVIMYNPIFELPFFKTKSIFAFVDFSLKYAVDQIRDINENLTDRKYLHKKG